jgi:hypothetical protein
LHPVQSPAAGLGCGELSGTISPPDGSMAPTQSFDNHVKASVAFWST